MHKENSSSWGRVWLWKMSCTDTHWPFSGSHTKAWSLLLCSLNFLLPLFLLLSQSHFKVLFFIPKAVLSVPVSLLSKSWFHSFTSELCGPNCPVTLSCTSSFFKLIWVNIPSLLFPSAFLPWACCLNLDCLPCYFIFSSHSGLFCPIPINLIPILQVFPVLLPLTSHCCLLAPPGPVFLPHSLIRVPQAPASSLGVCFCAPLLSAFWQVSFGSVCAAFPLPMPRKGRAEDDSVTALGAVAPTVTVHRL